MLALHLIVVVLVIAFPLWDYLEAAWLRSATAPRARERCYMRAMTGLWLAASAAVLATPAGAVWSPPPQMAALPRPVSPDFLAAFLPTLLAGLALPLAVAWFHAGARKTLLGQLDSLDYLLPRTHKEILLFAGLSISAGICEEVLYRGFLFHYLESAPWQLAPVPTVLLGSALFGLAHVGQGPKGVLVTAGAGLFLGGLYMSTGSLLLPVVVHALVDLRATAMAYLRTLPQPGAA